MGATRHKTSCPPVSLVARVPAVVGMRGRTGGCVASGWALLLKEVAVSLLSCSPAEEDLSQSPGAQPAAGEVLKLELQAVAITCTGGMWALWHRGAGGPGGEAARGRRKK